MARRIGSACHASAEAGGSHTPGHERRVAAGQPANRHRPNPLEPGATAVEAAVASVSRRGFLRSAAIAGGGLVAVERGGLRAGGRRAGLDVPARNGVAQPRHRAGRGRPLRRQRRRPAPSMDHSAAPSGSPAPPSAPADDHDADAKAVVERFLDGEYGKVEGAGNQPLEPTLDGDVKVFDMTVDKIQHRIDAVKDPVDGARLQRDVAGAAARGHRGRQGPGDLQEQPRRVDRHPLPRPAPAEQHGRRAARHPGPDPARRVVHLRVRRAARPARTCTTRTTTRPTRSGAACSARSSSSRRTRPSATTSCTASSQDIVWISNDALGGFTINGRGFPATAPIVATLGEKIVDPVHERGLMMHPWHLHGMPMHVVARDGYPAGLGVVHLRHARASTRASAGT